jgi:hypothetical protein
MDASKEDVIKPTVVGSTPTGPTINTLRAKICRYCKQPMHVHYKNNEIIYVGCEPLINDIRMRQKNDREILILGTRSMKTVICTKCRHKQLLYTFEEVKNGSKQNQI